MSETLIKAAMKPGHVVFPTRETPPLILHIVTASSTGTYLYNIYCVTRGGYKYIFYKLCNFSGNILEVKHLLLFEIEVFQKYSNFKYFIISYL